MEAGFRAEPGFLTVSFTAGCDFQPQHDVRLEVDERRSLGVFAGRYFLGCGVDGSCCAHADLDLTRLG